jgi:8-oxo-dGTP diphosphatase
MAGKQVQPIPRIGVGIIITNGNKVLFGKRVSKHGYGYWCPPGGKLEYQETIFECAGRETLEEANIEIKDCKVVHVTDDFFDDGQHFVTIYVQAAYKRGEPKANEPDKITNWTWVEWKQLPHPLFLPTQNLVDSGYSPFA